MTEREFARLSYLCGGLGYCFPERTLKGGAYKVHFWKYVANTRYHLWSAIDAAIKDTPVGMLIVARDVYPFERIQKHYRIVLLMVHPHYESAGVAERLLDAAIKSAILEDAHTIGADLDAKWKPLLDRLLFAPQAERVQVVRKLPAADYKLMGPEFMEKMKAANVATHGPKKPKVPRKKKPGYARPDRLAQIREFLIANGPAARSVIGGRLRLTPGTLNSLLTSKNFVKTSTGLWAVELPATETIEQQAAS